MPIITPDTDPGLHSRLAEAGAAVIPESLAITQDIRPATIAIVNLMPGPAMEATETQWLRYISHTVLQITTPLVKFDTDPRVHDNGASNPVLERYVPFSEIKDAGVDGLIVTGANLERKDSPESGIKEELPFGEINYSDQLKQLISWARENVSFSIYSCLASHFALNYLYGLEREILPEKLFGVFEHEVMNDSGSTFTADIDDTFTAPHSRWGNIPTANIASAGLGVLAVNPEIGWLLAEDKNLAGGSDLFIQGHPEYDRFDLHNEYTRDLDEDRAEPVEYYDTDGKPVLSWKNDSRSLHSNWINAIYRHISEAQN